jgi:hypothetical protein
MKGRRMNRADRVQAWHEIAVTALDEYEVAPPPTYSHAFVYSQALLATGRLHGWTDPRVSSLIAKLMSVRNPDGGWGVGRTWDAFGDGTTNPANTTYTVTLAGHVGPALLEAWKAGVLTDPEPLQTITKLLVSTSRVTLPTGQCVAYSRSSNDAGASQRVHNVNAGVADYLTQASAAGFGRTGLQKLTVEITRYEVSTYRTDWAGWPYIDGRTVEQDPDHGAYTARSLYFLTYPIGREAVYRVLNTDYAGSLEGARGHMQLVSTPGGPGSQGVADPLTTLWCEMGDRWLAEAEAYVSASAGDPMRLAQAAAWCAANADAS